MCKLPKVNKKRHQSDLIDLGTLSNIYIAAMSLLLTLKRFHTFSQYFIVGWIYQQKLKCRQVKIMKHARTGANYVILTKRIKVQHEKNPASYLKIMQNVGFEQTSPKFVEIFVA